MNENNNINVQSQFDPISLLQNSQSVKIKQKLELLELLTGCESKNRYEIYCQINNQNYNLFRAKEKSGCCMRNFCPGSSRSFKMNITLPNKTDFAVLERPFKCTCFCLARPEMNCKYSNGKKFGRIKEPFTCCSPVFETYDENDGSKFVLIIECCQRGFICSKCYELIGKIYKYGNLNMEVGCFTKKVKCCQEMFTDANTFLIYFPVDCTVEDKLNLIATVLLIDYRYFEESPQDKQQNFHENEK